MSNINYDVWGTPDTWGRGSWTPTNGPLPFIRVGAVNYSDSDFTDYPTVLYARKSQLWLMYSEGYLNINEFIDESLAYTAMANPELPQLNQYVFDNTHTTLNNPVAYTDNSRPLPFSLSMYYTDVNAPNPDINGGLSGLDGFPDNATVIGSQQLWRIAPFAYQGATYNTTLYNYNPNTHIIPFACFGIKSIILEINVTYRDSDNETHTTTLKSYLNHTSDWLHNHPLIRAWCEPYFRTNKNGSYTSSLSVTGATVNTNSKSVSPLFYQKYKCGSYDVQILTGNGYCIFGGWFPIYGTQVADGAHSYANLSYNIESHPDSTHVTSRPLIYGANKGTLRVTGATYSVTAWIDLDMSIAENVEYIMKGAAAYGMFFCTDIGTLGNSGRDSGATERWLDPDMYCGIIENDGMTYGNYTRGEGNKDNQIYGWKDSTQTPFDPSNIPETDNTHYDNETKFNHYGLTACSCNQYVVYEDDVVKLADIIATAINTRPDPDQLSTVDYALNNGLTNNPVDTIISVRAYPARSLPITEKLVGGVLTDHEPLHCGAWYNNDVTGYFLGSTFDIISFSFRRGTNNGFVAAFDNSFLDYAPYTRAELIIPYCGTVQLNPADFLNHDINVKIIVDYITGICTAFVMRENVAVMTVSGSMGIDVPITGLQNATYDSQRLNAVFNRENANANNASASVGLFGASVGLAASVASGNVVGAIASIAGIGATIAKQPTVQNALEKADYELTHQQLPTKVVQSGSPMISYVYENCCRLIVYRPVISEDFNPAVYADTVGFACLINGTVSQFTGLTVGSIDTAGVNCTEKEKEMIQKLFASGVYL